MGCRQTSSQFVTSGERHPLRFLKNPTMEPTNPQNEKLGEAPAAIALPVATMAMVPGSGVVPPIPLQLSMVLVSIVTAPLSARARPQSSVALVFRVMLWSAMMLPVKSVVVPRVAELPIAQ